MNMHAGFCFVLFVLLAFVGSAGANKSAVEILEPVRYSDNGQATVTCRVSQSANNFLHHTDRLRVRANGEEVGLWEFSWRNQPEGQTFTREVAIDAAGPLIIEAEATCNIHGSRGPAKLTIVPPDKKK